MTVPVISDAACDAYWPGYFDNTMVCAGSPTKDACTGDSGGPLAQGFVLVGVVSWGSTECADSSPGVYSKVSEPISRSWITSVTGI